MPPIWQCPTMPAELSPRSRDPPAALVGSSTEGKSATASEKVKMDLPAPPPHPPKAQTLPQDSWNAEGEARRWPADPRIGPSWLGRLDSPWLVIGLVLARPARLALAAVSALAAAAPLAFVLPQAPTGPCPSPCAGFPLYSPACAPALLTAPSARCWPCLVPTLLAPAPGSAVGGSAIWPLPNRHSDGDA
jgi:hypothetical protein